MNGTIRIRTGNRQWKEVRGRRVVGPWAVTQTNEGWSVSHVPTGMRVATFGTKRRAFDCTVGLWERMAADIRELYGQDCSSMRHATKLGRAMPRDIVRWIANLQRADAADKSPSTTSTIVPVRVTNRLTGATRVVNVSALDVFDDISICSGPCQCGPVEPDAEFDCGWPSLAETVFCGSVVEE